MKGVRGIERFIRDSYENEKEQITLIKVLVPFSDCLIMFYVYIGNFYSET